MRKYLVVAGLLLVSSSFAQAEGSQQNLFKCVDVANFSVDSNCTSSVIAASDQFQIMERDFQLKIEQQAPNVMATTQFFPAKMLIKVIAQKDSADDSELFASLP